MHDARVNSVLAETEIVERHESGELDTDSAVAHILSEIYNRDELDDIQDHNRGLVSKLAREALAKESVRTRGVFEEGEKVVITGILLEERDGDTVRLKIRDSGEIVGPVSESNLRRPVLDHSLYGVIEERDGAKYRVSLDVDRSVTEPISPDALSRNL